jgi:hypothetical protein
MEKPARNWKKILREGCQYTLAASALGCAVTARAFPGKISVLAQSGEILLGLVFLQVSPNFFKYFKSLNQTFSDLEVQNSNLEEFISIRRKELVDIEETIAAQEELSRQRIDALLSAERMELSEREAEVTAREQAIEEEEFELQSRVEALKAKILEESRLTLERERLQFEQQCEQELAQLAERKAQLSEEESLSIAEIEELEAQKTKEIHDFYAKQQSKFEEVCKLREDEFKEFKKEFLEKHHEQVDRLKARIEQLESELSHAANTIAQLQESFPEDLQPSTIAARTIRDVLKSQGINCQYKSSYLHEDGRIFVRLRIDYSEAKIRPYLGLIQQRLQSEKIALSIAKGAMQFSFMPDAASISARVEDSAVSEHQSATIDTFSAKPALEEPLENFLAFLKTMEDPLVPINPRHNSEISVVERNWVLKLWLIEKNQNQRHVCGIVYQARSSGDSRKFVMALDRVRKILDAYNIPYQVRKKEKVKI